jgi:putative ABC transport system permease protein
MAMSGQWFEIVGVVRDFGLDPNDDGSEGAFVFHAASADTLSSLAMIVRVRGNPASLVARLPVIAADVDAALYVREGRTLEDTIWRQDLSLIVPTAALIGVTLLVLFLSALGIFSLISVSVSRQTREIGIRSALGANPRRVLAGVMSRAGVLMGSGIAIGGTLLMVQIAMSDEDVALFAVWLALTAAVMLAAGVLACLGPARRALRINPTQALRES